MRVLFWMGVSSCARSLQVLMVVRRSASSRPHLVSVLVSHSVRISLAPSRLIIVLLVLPITTPSVFDYFFVVKVAHLHARSSHRVLVGVAARSKVQSSWRRLTSPRVASRLRRSTPPFAAMHYVSSVCHELRDIDEVALVSLCNARAGSELGRLAACMLGRYYDSARHSVSMQPPPATL